MLLPSLDNKLHKVTIFLKMTLFLPSKAFIKIKAFFFCVFFCFNFLLIKKIISYLFDVNYRLTFDLGGK